MPVFRRFMTDIELPLYISLASHKIHHDRLNDTAQRLLGLYEVRPNDVPKTSCRLQLHANALNNDTVPVGYCRAEGYIRNLNTIEEYQDFKNEDILSQSAHTLWDAINDGSVYECPSLLAAFFVASFADLKRYKFTYHSLLPAIKPSPAWRSTASSPPITLLQTETLRKEHVTHLNTQETAALVEAVHVWRNGEDSRQHGFFIANRVQDNEFRSSSTMENRIDRQETPEDSRTIAGCRWIIGSLRSYEDDFFKNANPEDRYVCFVDPSTSPTSPGWMLQNLLTLISRRWKEDKIQILCYRDTRARQDGPKSIVLRLEQVSPAIVASSVRTSLTDPSSIPEVEDLGLQKGKTLVKTFNLGDFMDPQRLADQAVDLNLQLIKWRIAPTLDLDKIKSTRCLLLGAGTLGSYVARNLMGWGVRKITFVDNGQVSFSNPVRQPLFTFKDCIGGGAEKAVRAAEALKEIYPGVDSVGYNVAVPMAGHPIMSETAVKDDFETLQRLVDEHDAIFLLMDTRESRWLPSVMGKAADKIVMNAALGFDTFVVMRHGMKNAEDSAQELGCYFCNDVVAPADSLRDRTLDQQCTVTRPGVAAIASALLVELLISVLQHPRGVLAPAPKSQSEDRGDHPLGIVPHQIRGFLPNFQNIAIRGQSYDCCSACSEKVIATYRKDGWAFVKRALNEKDYVEDLCGLTEVHRNAEQAILNMEINDAEDVGDDEGEII